MTPKPTAPTGKIKATPRPKRETVADWLHRIESTRKPRPDRDFAAMLRTGRGQD